MRRICYSIASFVENLVDHFFWRLKIRDKLVISFLIISILSIFSVGWVSYIKSRQTAEEQMNIYITEITKEINDKIQYSFRDIEKNFTLINFDKQIIQILKDTSGKIEFTTKLENETEIRKAIWNYIQPEHIIDVNDEYLKQICSIVNPTNSFFIAILDKDGGMVYQNSNMPDSLVKQLINTRQVSKAKPFSVTGIKKSEYYVLENSSDYMGWRIFNIVSIKSLMKNSMVAAFWTIAIGVVCIIFTVAASWMLALYIAKPMVKLGKLMERFMNGDMEVTIKLKRADEMGVLNRHFNEMTKRIRYLIEEVYQEQLISKDAQLKMLQAQINPHFLYNTLESINMLAKIYDVQDISDMVTSLGDLLRASFSKEKNRITIREELDYIKSYLFIQNIRYSNKFNFYYDVEDRILDYQIPKLLIQPIVENAIIHGLEEKDADANIQIKGYIGDGCLKIEIKDNGIGFTEFELKKIRAAIEDNQNNFHDEIASTGLGLPNVDKRIKLIFGDVYGVYIESIFREGTVVLLKLPM